MVKLSVKAKSVVLKPVMVAGVDPVAALSSMSSAVGPSITLPNTVGATSTPFVWAVGTGSSQPSVSPKPLR